VFAPCVESTFRFLAKISARAIRHSLSALVAAIFCSDSACLRGLRLPVLPDRRGHQPGHADDEGRQKGRIVLDELAHSRGMDVVVLGGFVFVAHGRSITHLPRGYQAKIGIVNTFEQGHGDDIQFPTTGFEASEVIVEGRRRSVADYFGQAEFDTRLPLVANYHGTKCNVTIRSLDISGSKITFFAPVFESVTYRHAKPIGDYSERFLSAIPEDIGNTVFCCNCIHNYVHGGLEGRRTGSLQGPMTFGEIAYQLLNQTLVYVTLAQRR
jgi:hypothetical protein